MAVKKDTMSAADDTAKENKATDPVVDEKNTTPKQKESAGDSGGFCVYLGPSIRGVIQSGAVFKGTKEDIIALLPAAVSVAPLIAKLIVPGETLAEDRIKVKTAGNLLNVNYNKLVTSLKSK